MKREDIIRMAREAGFEFKDRAEPKLERFFQAAYSAGAAAERKKFAAWMIQRGYATGHGDTTEDLLKELDWQVLANWSSAMKTGAENEREACAKVCEDEDVAPTDDAVGVQQCIAAAIRARRQS